MRLTDERVKYLMTPDPREAKQPVWAQDNTNGLRAALREALDIIETLRMEKTDESDLMVEVGTPSGADERERYVGLGHRSRVRLIVSPRRWANGEPRDYIEVSAGRPHKYGILKQGEQNLPTHLTVRGSDWLMVPAGSATNVMDVFLWNRELVGWQAEETKGQRA